MANLTPHFTEEELTQGEPTPPTAVRSNLTALAKLLEMFRRAWGDIPVRVTSGYRNPAHNAAVGGTETSQHQDGTAADVVPVGLTLYDAAHMIDEVERATYGVFAEKYGQLIFYPYTTGHIHISLPTRGKFGEKLVKLGGESGGYAKFDLGTFPRWKQRGKIGPCP